MRAHTHTALERTVRTEYLVLKLIHLRLAGIHLINPSVLQVKRKAEITRQGHLSEVTSERWHVLIDGPCLKPASVLGGDIRVEPDSLSRLQALPVWGSG